MQMRNTNTRVNQTANIDGVLVASLESVYITSIGRLVRSSMSRSESSSRLRLLREVDAAVSGCT